MHIFIGFSHSNLIGAKAISWWMRRPYSHIYIRFVSSDPSIPSTVYHAANGMVHFMTFDRFRAGNTIVKEYKINLTTEQRKNVLIACMNLSAERYGYCELVKIFLSDLAWMLFGREVNFNDGRGYICSELVAKILVDILGVNFSRPKYLIKPSHIDDKLKELNFELT